MVLSGSGFVPVGHLAISGDVFGCHNWVCFWLLVEVRDMAKHSPTPSHTHPTLSPHKLHVEIKVGKTSILNKEKRVQKVRNKYNKKWTKYT